MQEYTIIRGRKPVGVISIEGKTVLGLLQALKAETALIQDYGSFGVIYACGFYNSSGLEKDGGTLPELCFDTLFINKYGYTAFV